MSDWVPLFLLVWLVGAIVGTTFGVLLLRAGSLRPVPSPEPNVVEHGTREQQAA